MVSFIPAFNIKSMVHKVDSFTKLFIGQWWVKERCTYIVTYINIPYTIYVLVTIIFSKLTSFREGEIVTSKLCFGSSNFLKTDRFQVLQHQQSCLSSTTELLYYFLHIPPQHHPLFLIPTNINTLIGNHYQMSAKFKTQKLRNSDKEPTYVKSNSFSQLSQAETWC